MEAQSPNKGLVRIRFELGECDWHRTSVEGLWAEDAGPGRYELLNTPFYAYGVSSRDIVSVREHDDPIYQGELFFDQVVERGGNSTYRLFTTHRLESETFLEHWKPIELLGCHFEHMSIGTGKLNLVTINVPASTDVSAVFRLLTIGEERGVWDFEESHYGHRRSEN